jgi:hypothetical protein
MKKHAWQKPGYSFLRSVMEPTVWPPGFVSEFTTVAITSDQSNTRRSAGVTAANQRLRESESAAERQQGQRAMRGLSRTGDNLKENI